MKAWSRVLSWCTALLLAHAAGAAGFPLPAAGSFSAAGNFSISASATGSTSKFTLKAKLQVAPEDAGKTGMVYVIATLPGLTFFRQANGDWAYWTGGDFPANYQGTLGTHELNVIEDADLNQLSGIGFYVGYGTSQADMLANGKYSQIDAEPQEPPVALDGVWEVVSGTGILYGPGSYVVFDPSGMLVGVDRDGCTSVSSYVASANTITITVLFNQQDANCGAEVPVGTVIQANFNLDQSNLSLIASDGSTSVLRKFTVPYYSATGTYSVAAGSITWAASDFPCNGPMAGETSSVTVAAITETGMTWSLKGKTATWVRDGGTAGDITGTWRIVDPGSGNLYELTIEANGAVTLGGYVPQCGDNQIASEEYSVWTGMSRRMTPDGETTGLVLHMHGWAPQGTISQIALSGPSLEQTFFSHGLMDQNGVTVDDFVADNEITVPPAPGDVYTFTVTRVDGTTFTRSQTLATVLLDAPRITSLAGHALADANLGQPLSLSWTLPAGVTTNDVHISGQVCGKSGCTMVQGTTSSATTGSITLPAVEGATNALIDIRTHYAGEVFMICWYEFR